MKTVITLMNQLKRNLNFNNFQILIKFLHTLEEKSHKIK